MKNQMDMKSLPKLGSTRKGRGNFTNDNTYDKTAMPKTPTAKPVRVTPKTDRFTRFMKGEQKIEGNVAKVLTPIDKGVRATFRVGKSNRRAGWKGWY